MRKAPSVAQGQYFKTPNSVNCLSGVISDYTQIAWKINSSPRAAENMHIKFTVNLSFWLFGSDLSVMVSHLPMIAVILQQELRQLHNKSVWISLQEELSKSKPRFIKGVNKSATDTQLMSYEHI